MLYAVTWFVVLFLLALWSLTVWAGHAATAWAVSQAGAIGDAAAGLAQVPVPEWLAPWLPADALAFFSAAAASVQPLMEGLMQLLPGWSGVLAVLAWGLWGLGALLLLGLGAAGHLLVAVFRRRGPRGGGTPPAAGWQQAG